MAAQQQQQQQQQLQQQGEDLLEDEVDAPGNGNSADKTKAEAAKALDKMTDVVPEKQELDESKVQKAMTTLATTQQATQAANRQREKELAAVKVAKEDIDVVATEAEVDKKAAERRLREHGGDLAAALKSYL